MKPRFIIFFCAVAMQSLPSLAALGSVPNTAGATITRLAGYSVSEVVLVSGTHVREYVSPTNVVFGVGWQGPAMPDLTQVLGRYVGQVNAGASAGDSGRALDIGTSDFVLHSAGHMRSFRGNAYVPSLVPIGVSTDNIN